MQKAPKGMCPGIVKVEPAVNRSQPDTMTTILDSVLYFIIADACRIIGLVLVDRRLSAAWVQYDLSAAIGADPDEPLAVYQQCIDEIRGWVYLVTDKPVFSPVIPVHPAAPGGDPQVSIRIFGDSGDKIVADASWIGWNILVDGKAIAVVLVEAVPRPEPHEPPAIVQHADDIALGKARLRADVLEPRARRLR